MVPVMEESSSAWSLGDDCGKGIAACTAFLEQNVCFRKVHKNCWKRFHIGKCLDACCLPSTEVYSLLDKDLDELSLQQASDECSPIVKEHSKGGNEMRRRFEIRGQRRPITDFYEIKSRDSLLGEGAMGVVKQWTSKHTVEGQKREEVAVKHINWVTVWHGYTRDKMHEKELRRELRILMMMDCPYIVRAREWFEHPRLGVYFVMELCSGGKLQDLLEKICGTDAELRICEYHWRLRRAFLHISYALAYLHGMNPPMVHRDLKPDNVLFKMNCPKSACKLVDFGLSSLNGDMSALRWKQGTQVFMAPQQFLQDEPDEGQVMPALDMWSLGVILTWMVSALYRGTLQHPLLNDAKGQGFDVKYHNLLRAHSRLRFDSDKQKLQTSPDKRSRPRDFRRDLFSGDEVALDLAEQLLVFEADQRSGAVGVMYHPWTAWSESGVDDPTLRATIGTNLRTFASLSVLDRTIISLIATRLDANELEDEPLAMLRQLRGVFRNLDVSKVGWLSDKEVVQGFKDIPGGFSQKDADDLFTAMLRHASKKLYWTDWLTAAIGAGILQSEAVISAAFTSLDTQHKVLHGSEATIDRGDLAHLIGRQHAAEVFEVLGVEQITFEHFQKIIRSIASRREAIRISPQRPQHQPSCFMETSCSPAFWQGPQ